MHVVKVPMSLPLEAEYEEEEPAGWRRSRTPGRSPRSSG